jgi:methionyl-tRNA formyltransferase
VPHDGHRPAGHGRSRIAARVIGPVRRALRRRKADYIDVPAITRAASVPLIETFDVNERGFLGRLRGLGADLFVSAAYPQIFGAELLAIPGRGAVNFHPSLLPKFRGAHPHFWAIATGASTSGLTAHYMTPSLDDGDVIAQTEFPIAALTYSQLYARIVAETPALVARVAAFMDDPSGKATPQDHSQATQFRNDREIHRRIFWRMHSADEVRNLCRTEKAFCYFRDGRRLTLRDATVTASNRNLTNGVRAEPGAVVDVTPDGTLVLAAREACVAVATIDSAGRRWPAGTWARRCRLGVGEMFT